MKTTLLAAFLLVIATELPAADAAHPPNIILMMADDMGFSDISPYGGEIHTPNLQRLADEGLRFTQFYNNAKCTSTRACLLSGMYPRNNGNSIPRGIPTIGETMRAAGYQTGMSGKWHLGNKAPQRPFDRGFDEYYGLMDGAVNYFNPAQPDPAFKGGKVRTFGHNDQLITEFPKDFYTTDYFTSHTIETIERFAKTGKPFFIHLAFNAPHYPLQAWPEDIAKYRGQYKMGWEELRRQRYARQIAMGVVDSKYALSPTDSQSYDFAKANQDWEDLRMATYAAMIDRMDQNIGRVLKKLDELGIAKDTLVLFLSDNGGCTEEPGGRDDTQQPGIVSTYTAVGPGWGWAQNTPFRRYKSWVNEGGISTPFIARWPGQVKAGTMTGQLAHIIDVLPTCLELAGAPPLAEINGEKTKPLEGQSLVPILRGGTRPAPAELCWEWAGNCAIRHDQWKLVWDTLSRPLKWELYDIEADRTELRNLADEKPELVKELSEAYARWAKATGRRLPGEKGKKGSDE
ncbi:MAG: arylsulfatase [Chthoniobacter sp.]|uniref:arylsulfatase n=1 Tax=Chthoniobacter sp. TaxID=2510640 RepID=UPI0032A833F5